MEHLIQPIPGPQCCRMQSSWHCRAGKKNGLHCRAHTSSFTRSIFHTQLCHTHTTTYIHTYIRTYVRTYIHTYLPFYLLDLSPPPLSFLPSLSPLKPLKLIIGRSWLVGLSGPLIWNATALFNIGNATATKETEASETHKEATTSATAFPEFEEGEGRAWLVQQWPVQSAREAMVWHCWRKWLKLNRGEFPPVTQIRSDEVRHALRLTSCQARRGAAGDMAARSHKLPEWWMSWKINRYRIRFGLGMI